MLSPRLEKYTFYPRPLRSRDKVQLLQVPLGGSAVTINLPSLLKWCPERNWVGVNGTHVNFHYSSILTARRIASIVAGDDHLLAVTSKGRTFVHPVNMQANNYGQLGIRQVEVQNDSVSFTVDLIPKPVVDPFVKASLANRGPRPSEMSDEASKFDDKSIHFCPYLFEIPVLRGVLVEQVAAGSKNSFARTNTGRVLAWGANRHGCVSFIEFSYSTSDCNQTARPRQ